VFPAFEFVTYPSKLREAFMPPGPPTFVTSILITSP